MTSGQRIPRPERDALDADVAALLEIPYVVGQFTMLSYVANAIEAAEP